MEKTGLERFHPLVKEWFLGKYGRPTDIQEKAWGLIAGGEHALISAATGSGKTLAAFLWGLDQLISGRWESGRTRVIYISPLKALNNDIQRNLLEPLGELRTLFEVKGEPFPEISVKTRSGDTSQNDRRKMLRRPPEILITTPESLNLLLTSPAGQRALMGVECLILDEIHSVVASKRGAYLMSGVERLAFLNGEFQRIALSATVRPMETVGAFVGGYRYTEGALDGELVARPVRLAVSDVVKSYEIEARFPEETDENQSDDDFWLPIVMQIKELVAKNESTLIFVNSRQMSEKLVHKINKDEIEPIAYSHHGSLSREIRAAVELRMKKGELKAIVATNSLEMGIDIGALDCVVMVQCPNAISSAIQKIGRAGHQVGAVSRSTLFPAHSRDFLEAAVLARAIREKDIEPVKPIKCPLDVLAQVIVSVLGSGERDLDELYRMMVASYTFRELQRREYDLVLDMMSGRYAASRLRELKPRIAIDRSRHTATLRKGALMTFYLSGGVIPDRGYFHLRLEGSGARIGELDEEFVWERVLGDVFTLGTQSWKILKITFNDVFVASATSGGVMPPFWRSEGNNRDFHYSTRIGAFLEEANEDLGKKNFETKLARGFSLDGETAKQLHRFLSNQKSATGCDLPHRRHLVAELINRAPHGAMGQQWVLHTHWGGRVNRPYGLALSAAWQERHGVRPEIYANNDCIAVTVEEAISAKDVLGLVRSENVEALLRQSLEGSGFFGARFRECAGAALLITRQRANQRLPLWLSRMRSKGLLDSVKAYDDFPLLLETWRTCLQDEFDMESLKLVLAELEQGMTAVTDVRTAQASPFAKSVAWRQINDEYMYDSDKPTADGKTRLREDLLKTFAFNEALRPRVKKEIAAEYQRKRQRLETGYAPTDFLELKEWLRERVAMTREEWGALLTASKRDGAEVDEWDLSFASSDRLFGGEDEWVFLKEEVVRARALNEVEGDANEIREWLSYFGPVEFDALQERLGVEREAWIAFVDALADEQAVVVGPLFEDSEKVYVCDAENFETLLRMQRTRNRAVFEALPIEELAPFLANQQGLLGKKGAVDALGDMIEVFTGLRAKAEVWEEDVLPARLHAYQTSWLDSLMLEGDLHWYGSEGKRIGFAYTGELEEAKGSDDERDDIGSREGEVLGVLERGRFSLQGLVGELELLQSEVEESVWSLVWKGSVSNDSFAALRRGLLADFKTQDAIQQKRVAARSAVRVQRGRVGRSAGRGLAMYPGNWYELPKGSGEEVDEIETLESQKLRARILLDRYGTLFRELLLKEAPGFQWKDVFKALRLMELSGELVAGRFFDGLSGLQFASHEALRALRRGVNKKAIYWHSAVDPVSLCGLGIEAFKGRLPKRLSSNRMVWRGSELALVVSRNGKSLMFHVPPDDPDLPEILEVARHLLTRSFRPMPSVLMEEINGESALRSPYLPALEANFRMHRDHKRVVIEL